VRKWPSGTYLHFIASSWQKCRGAHAYTRNKATERAAPREIQQFPRAADYSQRVSHKKLGQSEENEFHGSGQNNKHRVHMLLDGPFNYTQRLQPEAQKPTQKASKSLRANERARRAS